MENQTLSSENTTQTIPVAVPPVQEKKKVNVWILVSLLLLLIIFGFLLWYILVGSKVPNTPTNSITNTTTTTSEILTSESSSTQSSIASLSTSSISREPEILSEGSNINKYINYELGFSIKFPKTENVATTCDEASKEKTGKMPITTFKIGEKSFIISDTKIVQWWRTPCTVIDNNLFVLQNGFNKGEENLGYKNYPNHTYIAFNKVESDKDLQTIIDLIPQYNACFVGPKKLMDNSTDIYEVTLVDKNGKSDDMESDCYINAMYYFYYSTTNKSAVLTNATQSMRFTNEQTEQSDVSIEFTNK